MKSFSPLTIIFSLLMIVLYSCKKEPGITSFELDKIQKNNAALAELITDQEFKQRVLKIKPTEKRKKLTIWEKGEKEDFPGTGYLVCQIWHKNHYAGVIRVNFYKNSGEQKKMADQGSTVGSENDKPRISAKLGILPDLKTNLIFPLSHLDGQEIFMRRFPRQLKGTVTGNRILPEDISRVELEFDPVSEPDFTPEFEIFSICHTDVLPDPLPAPDTPVVDPFGQWTGKDWKGKITSEDQLKEVFEKQLQNAQTGSFPEDWSRFGGWKKIKLGATGYFRTHHDGKRWWLVDPEGYAFISVGVDCIRNNSSGLITGQEDLFQWLPDSTDTLFKRAYSGRGPNTYFDFYRSNLIRVFGEKWLENWEIITAGNIKELRLNTIANWSDIDFCRKARIPYVLPLANFPGTRKMLYRDFPDVFSDEYRDNSVKFAFQLNEFKNDRYLIGYFLRNEPHWAFGANNIAFEMFGDSTHSVSKSEFINWISKQYESIRQFNSSWNLNLGEYNQLSEKVFVEYPSEKAEKDFWKFSEILVANYVNIPCDEVEKIDPNHLNLGMRYAWLSSDLLYKAGERFDVFSINGYSNPGPPATAEISGRSGKPVMIGEFHFGAVDRGLPATGIQGAISQKDRGEAYRYYAEQGLARPELIGIHYFQWLDQPVFGRFDGENYNIGFLDICNQPYPELTKAALETHKRMYQVASGVEKPFDQVIKKVPAIYY